MSLIMPIIFFFPQKLHFCSTRSLQRAPLLLVQNSSSAFPANCLCKLTRSAPNAAELQIKNFQLFVSMNNSQQESHLLRRSRRFSRWSCKTKREKRSSFRAKNASIGSKLKEINSLFNKMQTNISLKTFFQRFPT